MSFWNWLFRRNKKTVVHVAEQQTTFSSTDRIRLVNAPYLLPKDAEEDNRLNFQHYALYHALGSHYVTPLPPYLDSILDVGCGTGIWDIEMAHQFPQAKVIGVDISDSSFRLLDLPANCTLTIGNILEGLKFPDQQFAYTHQRFLVAAVTAERWPDVVHELVRVTRIGGWVELLEIGVTIQNAGPATQQLLDWMSMVAKSLGFDMGLISHLGELLTREGLQSVESEHIPAPLGDWAGRVGSMLKSDVLSAYNALKGLYCKTANVPIEEFERVLQIASAEWETNKASYVFHAAYGKRVV